MKQESRTDCVCKNKKPWTDALRLSTRCCGYLYIYCVVNFLAFIRLFSCLESRQKIWITNATACLYYYYISSLLLLLLFIGVMHHRGVQNCQSQSLWPTVLPSSSQPSQASISESIRLQLVRYNNNNNKNNELLPAKSICRWSCCFGAAPD